MEPFLCEGDLVAILPYDESPTLDEIKHTNIYLAKIPDGFGGYGLSIKHISVIDNYKIDLVSENKKYDNLRIDLSKTPDFKILGRVIWMWREF
jgi:phage repressor protein C with HTH and peptisase S24 domain